MKLEEGHHIKVEGLTPEQFDAFCEECIRQGFGKGEWKCYKYLLSINYLGIYKGNIYFGENDVYSPEDMLEYSQVVSEVESSDFEETLIKNAKDLHEVKKKIKELQQRESELKQWFLDELELE